MLGNADSQTSQRAGIQRNTNQYRMLCRNLNRMIRKKHYLRKKIYEVAAQK